MTHASRDLAIADDPNRPGGLRLSARGTGLPVAVRHIRRIESSAPATSEAPVTPEQLVGAGSGDDHDDHIATSDDDSRRAECGKFRNRRVCESGDNYAEDTGNGYYGAYQFSLSTWYGLGPFTGLPSEAVASQPRTASS